MSRRKSKAPAEEPRYCPECGAVWVAGRRKCSDCEYWLLEVARYRGPETCTRPDCGRDDILYRGTDPATGDQVALCYEHTGPQFKSYTQRMFDHKLAHRQASTDECREHADRFEAQHQAFFARQRERKGTARQTVSKTPGPAAGKQLGAVAGDLLDSMHNGDKAVTT